MIDSSQYMYQEKYYTVRQVAEIEGISKQAIIERCKANKYSGAKKIDSSTGPHGLWLIPKKLFDTPIMTKEVAEVTRQITPAELKESFKLALREEFEPLKDEIKQLRAELEAHNRKIDERLRETVTSKQKSLWEKFFGK